MPTNVDFDSLPQVFTPQPARVWTRTAWADAWTLRSDLFPLEAQFTLAPEPNTATLYRRYGYVQNPGSVNFTTQTAETARGYWVLIEYPDDDGGAPYYWLGYAESPIDSNHHPARDGLPACGEQTIPCFGMLEVLRWALIESTVHVDPDDDEELVRTMEGSIFNAGDKGNRHTDKATITEDGDTSDSAHGFALPDQADADWWSTRDIVEHLVAFHLPTPTGLTGAIPFTVDNLTQLPDWDRPVVETDGRSVGDILDELLSVDRLLVWGVGATATPGTPPTITSILIHPNTTVASALTLPAFGDVPANPDTFTITNTTDGNTRHSVTKDDSEVVDQVVVRGPLEIGVATYRHEDNPDEASADELENDWESVDEVSYENGGDGVTPGFAALEQYEQREHNERIRRSPDLVNVFRRFRIKSDWDGKANDEDVFTPTPADPDPITFRPYLAKCEFLSDLPLFAGVDYTGDPTLVDETTGQDVIGPIVTLLHPKDDKHYQFKQTGRLQIGFRPTNEDAVPFELEIDPNNDNGPKIDVLVSGGPNHAIAGPIFIGNDADVDQDLAFGSFHYNTLAATLAMTSGRRPFWKLPADDDFTGDVKRKKVVTIEHPALQLVHIAVDTVVGFDDDGVPETSDGGVLRDPTDVIKSIATVLADHFLNARSRLELRTMRRPTEFQTAGIVTTVSDFGSIDAVIRSITIRTPLDQPGIRPTYELIAAKAIADPMQLIVPDVELTATPPDPPNRRDKAQEKLQRRRLDQANARWGFDRQGQQKGLNA